jgi:hypothetical protein
MELGKKIAKAAVTGALLLSAMLPAFAQNYTVTRYRNPVTGNTVVRRTTISPYGRSTVTVRRHHHHYYHRYSTSTTLYAAPTFARRYHYDDNGRRYYFDNDGTRHYNDGSTRHYDHDSMRQNDNDSMRHYNR